VDSRAGACRRSLNGALIVTDRLGNLPGDCRLQRRFLEQTCWSNSGEEKHAAGQDRLRPRAGARGPVGSRGRRGQGRRPPGSAPRRGPAPGASEHAPAGLRRRAELPLAPRRCQPAGAGHAAVLHEVPHLRPRSDRRGGRCHRRGRLRGAARRRHWPCRPTGCDRPRLGTTSPRSPSARTTAPATCSARDSSAWETRSAPSRRPDPGSSRSTRSPTETTSGSPAASTGRRSSTSEMVFDVPHVPALLSAVTTLLPGGLVSTGTASRVGVFREPRRHLCPGDELHSNAGVSCTRCHDFASLLTPP